MTRLFLFLTGLLVFNNAIGQEIQLSGTVTDAKTGETLIGVNVQVDRSGVTSTDNNGRFSIAAMPGVHSIEFTYIGYQTETRTVEAQAGETKELKIALKPKAEQLKMVVVSAGKFEQRVEDVTVSMEVVQPELIEGKNTYDMETIMEQVPGMVVTDGQANIRGGSGFVYGAGSRVLVLVDDMPMLAADANDVKWNFLPIENLEQVEVVKGASSALYGSSALNGVIHVRTASPVDTPQTKINAFHGMFHAPVRIDSAGKVQKPLKWWDGINPMFSGFDFFHSRQAGNLDVVVGGNAVSDQGYREGETDQRFRLNSNLRYRSKKVEGLSYGLNMNGQRNQGGLFLLWQNADSGALRPQGGLDTATTTATFFTSYRANVDPYVQYVTANNTKHTFRNRYFYTSNLSTSNQSSEAHLIYNEYQFQKRYKKDLTVTAGLLSMYNIVQSDLYGDRSGNNAAGYAQADKRWGRFSLSGGLRAEYFKIDTAQTQTDITLGKLFQKQDDSTNIVLAKNAPVKPVIRLGMNYQLLEATWLRASYGEGYRFPSIAEKFVSTSVGLLRVFPNPELQAETGVTAEIGAKQGLKFGTWKGFVDLAGFWSQYDNTMEFTFGVWNPDTVPPSFAWAGFKSLNVGKSRVSGAEISVVAQGKLLGLKTTVFGGYTYMNPVNFNDDPDYLATISDTSSNMLKYRYRHLAKLDVQFEKGRWTVGLSGRYNSFMETVDALFEEQFILQGVRDYRQQHNKGDYVFDARIAAKISKKSRLALVVNNVLNREYMGRPGDIRPPRNSAVRYSVRF